MDARAPSLHRAARLDLPADIAEEAAAIVAAVEAPSTTLLPGLNDHQMAMLDFERQWWRRPGAKEQAIRDSFEMSPTRYYQTLNSLIELPAAVHYDPVLVNRLLRLRSSAVRARRPQ